MVIKRFWLTGMVVFVLTLLLGLGFMPRSVAAAMDYFYVDQAIGSDGNDGLSWGGAKKTITAAIGLMGENSATISVAQGSYHEHITIVNHLTLAGGYPSGGGTRDITSYITTIDGGNSGSVVLARQVEHAVIDGFTITHGDNRKGGGLLAIRSELDITNNIITANSAVNGAGIYAVNHKGIIDNNTINYNVATRSGGGIYITNFKQHISNNIIVHNSAGAGGGLYVANQLQAAAHIYNNIISENTVSGYGGGLYLADCLSPILNNIILGNSATSSGGGFYLVNGKGDIENNIIAKNSGWLGGAIYLGDSSSKITNNTIADNISATNVAGGIALTGYSGEIKNTIFWENTDDIFSGENIGVTYCDLSDTEYTGGEGNFSLDPEFVAPAADNYHIQKTSPCRDVGTAVGAPGDDIDGDSRPEGAGYDVGADEYTAGAPAVTVQRPNGGDVLVGTDSIIWLPEDQQETGEDALVAAVYWGTSPSSAPNLIQGGIPCTSGVLASINWDTTTVTDGDNYYIRVVVSDGELEGEDFSDGAFTVDNTAGEACADSLELVADKPSPGYTGTMITWTATASDPDGDDLYYRFWWRKPGAANYELVQDWSADNTWDWHPGVADVGKNRILVFVKDGNSHYCEGRGDKRRDKSAAKGYEIRLYGTACATDVSLAPDKASPQLVGTTIVWTGQATDADSNTLYYRFLWKQVGGTYTVMREWATDNSWEWVPGGEAEGRNKILLLVKDSNEVYCKANWSSDATKVAKYKILPTGAECADSVSLVADKPSPQHVGVTIEWTAAATDADSNTIYYRFLWRKEGGSFEVEQEWSTDNTWEWYAGGDAVGKNRIAVHVKDDNEVYCQGHGDRRRDNSTARSYKIKP